MQELIEQAIDYLKGIWIKRRYIIISTWLICPPAWIFISQLDDVYESQARVYADTQSILGPLLKGLTVESNPDYQIQLMVKTLLSRPNLERITRMTDLDVQANTPIEYEELIDRLRKDIIIKKTGGRRENIFTITFDDKDPEMAKSVVQSALTVFIENTLGENRSDSDSAQKFLDTQIKDYENRLLAAESRLTDFKQKYSDVLPNQYGGYYQKLTNTKEQLKGIELGLLEAKTQLSSARTQLQNNSTSSIDKESKIQDSNSIQTAYDSRITELETTLDSLLLKYTDRHPDVIEVNKRLAHLNAQRTNEIEKYIAASSGENPSSIKAISANPVMQEVQIQVNQLENQVASFEVRAENYRQQVKELESKIHILPEIEAELVALNRGYEITKGKYEELLSRKETAQLAKQADETTNKIQFRVIDPPRAPTEPTGPKRILFLIAATIFGAGVGVGLSLLTSQINPVVTSGAQATKETGIPVFGIIAATDNLGLQQWHKKKTRIFIFSNVVLLTMLCLIIIFNVFSERVMPLIKGVL